MSARRLAALGSLVLLTAGPHSAAAARQMRTTWTGVYSRAQAMRAEPVYEEQCGSCHGSDLRGGGFAPALVGSTFAGNWNGATLEGLLDRIRTTMPLAAPGSLSRAQCADILAFILSKGGFPAGEMELASQQEILKQIAFVATER